MKQPKHTDKAAEKPHTADAPPEPTQDAAAADSAAAAKPAAAPGGEPRPGQKFLTLSWPLPDNIPERALAEAQLVVKAKGDKGRRRAGFAFSREETVIPLTELKAGQIAALADDRELVVAVRVPAPS